jgi:symplekin
MASAKTLTVWEQIQQLNEARKIVLENPSYYQKIVEGILPAIRPSAPIELRRWGADFLAESLSTPVLSIPDKVGLTIAVLGTLRELVESQKEDPLVLRSAVIAAASAFPHVLRWT